MRDPMPTFPETAWFDFVPDWVCDVQSSSTRKNDKSEINAMFDVKRMWFVDRDARTLIAYELNNGAWAIITTLRDDDPVCVAPLTQSLLRHSVSGYHCIGRSLPLASFEHKTRFAVYQVNPDVL